MSIPVVAARTFAIFRRPIFIRTGQVVFVLYLEHGHHGMVFMQDVMAVDGVLPYKITEPHQ